MPMKQLVTLLDRDGLSGARSYIQSGNLVLRTRAGTAEALAKRIGKLVLKNYEFEPRVFVLSVADVQSAVAANPFPHAEAAPQTLHLFFLAGVPQAPDMQSLNGLRTGQEAFALKGAVFYLHSPDGLGVSRLAGRAEKLIGVDATARNWRTVGKLLELARD